MGLFNENGDLFCIAFLDTVLGRELSGKVLKQFYGNFCF